MKCCGAAGRQKFKMSIANSTCLVKSHVMKFPFRTKGDVLSPKCHYLFVPSGNDTVWVSYFFILQSGGFALGSGQRQQALSGYMDIVLQSSQGKNIQILFLGR